MSYTTYHTKNFAIARSTKKELYGQLKGLKPELPIMSVDTPELPDLVYEVRIAQGSSLRRHLSVSFKENKGIICFNAVQTPTGPQYRVRNIAGDDHHEWLLIDTLSDVRQWSKGQKDQYAEELERYNLECAQSFNQPQRRTIEHPYQESLPELPYQDGLEGSPVMNALYDRLFEIMGRLQDTESLFLSDAITDYHNKMRAMYMGNGSTIFSRFKIIQMGFKELTAASSSQDEQECPLGLDEQRKLYNIWYDEQAFQGAQQATRAWCKQQLNRTMLLEANARGLEEKLLECEPNLS